MQKKQFECDACWSQSPQCVNVFFLFLFFCIWVCKLFYGVFVFFSFFCFFILCLLWWLVTIKGTDPCTLRVQPLLRAIIFIFIFTFPATMLRPPSYAPVLLSCCVLQNVLVLDQLCASINLISYTRLLGWGSIYLFFGLSMDCKYVLCAI